MNVCVCDARATGAQYLHQKLVAATVPTAYQYLKENLLVNGLERPHRVVCLTLNRFEK